MSNTGIYIRKAREKKGYSQEYMADKLDINQATYARLENEETKITLDRLYKISEILEVNILDLLDNEKNLIQTQNNNEGAYI